MYNVAVVVECFFAFLVIKGFVRLTNTFVSIFTVFVIGWALLFMWRPSTYPPFYSPLQ